MNDAQTPTRTSARLALWLACAWVAAGASFKLFAGSPADLPPTIQDFPFLRPEWTFNLAIGVELSIVFLALVRPRPFWALLALLFVVFDVLLWQMIQAGEASCGCFGSDVPLKPMHMFVIDSVLLLGLVVTRVWSGFPKRPLKPALVLSTPIVAGLLAWPWFWIDYGLEMPPQKPVVESGETKNGEDVVDVPEPEAPKLPDWYRFEPAKWEGQLIGDVDLASFLVGGADTAWSIPAPAHVVLYRLSCDHCRLHFEKLMEEPLGDDMPVVLIQVPEDTDAADVVTQVKPQGAFEFELVPLPRGYGVTTPVLFDLDEGWTITNVAEK